MRNSRWTGMGCPLCLAHVSRAIRKSGPNDEEYMCEVCRLPLQPQPLSPLWRPQGQMPRHTRVNPYHKGRGRVHVNFWRFNHSKGVEIGRCRCTTREWRSWWVVAWMVANARDGHMYAGKLDAKAVCSTRIVGAQRNGPSAEQ